MKKIKAIFRGENGSCGYTTNHEYELNLSQNAFIEIQDKNGEGFCRYGSIISFLNNWDNIRVL